MHATVRTRTRSILLAGMALALCVAVLVAPAVASAASHTISGRVFNNEDAGVDNCEVALYSWDAGGSQWVRVNYVQPLDGNYSFGAVADGTYRLGVEALAYPTSPIWEYALPIYANGSTTVTDSVDIALSSDTVLNWKLERNPAITGHVSSAVDGSPIANASVDLYWYDVGATSFYPDTVMTNPTGDYITYVPNRGSFILAFRKDGWATSYNGVTPRFSEAEVRGAAPWVLDAALDLGVSFRIERAVSPFGTQLPGAWTMSTVGLPYTVEVYRRVTPPGIEPAEYEAWWILPAGAHSAWPTHFPGGGYKVKFVPPSGTYLPLWHSGVSEEASAQVVEALPGQAINVWARFGGYVKAKSSLRSSARAVKRGRSVRLTITVQDASITGRTPFPQRTADVKLQRSYDKRTWKTIATLRTGSVGVVSKSVKVTKTAYYRAVPVASATLQGSASSSVKVGAVK